MYSPYVHYPRFLLRGRLINNCRYGIHGMRREHFGMVVAERQRAGCLVFMPGLGGCAEIVDNPALAFADLDEAVERFDAVLTSETGGSAVRSHQDERAHQFTTNQFCAQLRDHVNAFLHEQLSEPPAKPTKGRPQST